jgi:hypothetical protein
MKPKTILFLVGAIVLVLGILPLLKFIPVFSNIINTIPPAGSTAYQILIALVGFIAVVLSLQKKQAVQVIQRG